MAQALDAVAVEAQWTRLISVTDEAAAALVRTSFSPLVRESHDFSCVLTDPAGRSLAQATKSIPSFIGTLPRSVRAFLDVYPLDRLAPGDVLITNDIYDGTGHLPDITVAKPIFRDGVVVGIAASTAHAPDIGGKIRSPEPREVFEEGFQIPIMKLMSAGRPDETLIKLLRKNVRVPDQTIGDLWAQLAALDLMERRTLRMMDDYGLATLEDLAAEIHSRSERAMRAAIAELPDGVYREQLQTDGLQLPVTLEMSITVRGEEIAVDLAGSSPQVDRAINVAYCYTYAMVMYGLKCAICPHVPNNEGSFNPITVTAPEGSIVNPRFPAAGGSRLLVGHYLPTLVMKCLGGIAPDSVIAACGSPLWGMNQSGTDEAGKPYANMLFFNGGMGASSAGEGETCLSWPSNVSSTSIEVTEHISPLRVVQKRIVDGSGGPGRHRGGNGQQISFVSRARDKIAVSFLAERTRIAAEGIAGGGAGQVGEVRVDGSKVDPKRQYVLEPGATIDLITPGGGGWGGNGG